MSIAASWGVIVGAFAVAALWTGHRRGVPRGYTPLPPLGDGLQPMSLQPLGSIWRSRKETDL